MKKKSTMRIIYDSKAFWVIVSLLCSLAIWVYVSSIETEEFKETFRGVKVELIGEESLRENKNMVITDLDTSTVTLEIVGPRRIVGSLDSKQLSAQIDVSRLSRAAYTSQQYTVKFPDGLDISNLRVNRKSPETVNFMVSAQTSKSIQVRGSFDGKLEEGYTAETPVFEPSTITVSGAESNLRDVSYAWVSFGDDETINGTYTVDTGYTLMNENDEPCATTGLIFSDEVVRATLPVLMVKDVKLDVNLVPGAGATTENTVVKIEPAFITLAGDSSLLSGLNKIVLDTIDLTKFSATMSEEYTIPLDNNVKNLTGVTAAKVTVEITGLNTKAFNVKNISIVNVTDGFEADLVTESLTVTLRGTDEVLAQIKESNIRAEADLTDYNASEGSYLAPVKIKIDGFTDVGAVGEYSVNLNIRKNS